MKMNKQQIMDHTKQMDAFTIDIDGTITEVKPEDGRHFSLDELYKHTNSEIVQVVSMAHNERLMVCDEEGIMNDKEANRLATEYLRGEGVILPGAMLGKVLVMDREMME